MSQANVQAVRRWIDAYNRRDFEGLIEVTDPDFDFRSRFVALESGFRGYERFPHAYFATLDEAYDRFQVIPSELIDAGAGAFAAANAEWRGKTSGAEGSLPIFVAYWLRAGKLVRAETFTERSAALDALGLAEGDQESGMQNVEVVRRVFEAADRGDTGAIFDLYDEHIVWDATRTERGAMAGRVVLGKEALLKWLREWYEAWETIEDVLEELIDAGEQRVVSIMVQRGRGRASGVEVADRLGTVWTLQEAKVIRVVWFPSRDAALEAAGLVARESHADS